MVTITTLYEGDLRCNSTHDPSGIELRTDAPIDNEGRGESFSPTDLVATALGTCAVTTMGIVARRQDIAIAGTEARVEKVMTKNPRRVAGLRLEITVRGKLTADQKVVLEDAARNCPVFRSIHPDIDAPCKFEYPDDE